ncbi:MAG: thiosulfate oxidation carrier protein SoxY [Rhodospirillales bacterium]|nr:thiosulfate oxidation carrier protein SoxY [Rhodospirillales bacterium]
MGGTGLAVAAGACMVLRVPQAAAADAAPMASAASWPIKAFAQKTQADALQALFGSVTLETSPKVALDVPEIAENGAVVPVSVDASALSGVQMIALLVPDNPFTLTAAYPIAAGTAPNISCRLKMAKTSNVIAVVQAGGKLYATTKQVKVTLGGCGG